MLTNNHRNKAEREARSLFGFFIAKFRLTYLILGAIILLGSFSLFTLPREADPEVQIPFAVVSAVYPGATPQDVEALVTDKLEDKIATLEQVRRFTSSSNTGISSIFVEYEAEADLAESIRKLEDAVSEAAPSLPSDALDPVVTEIRANDFPIVTYSLVGGYSGQELKDFAETLQAAFENIRGVSKVPILGGTAREFQIIADPARLANFGISLGQVAGAIGRANINVPAGSIDIDGFSYNVRVQGSFQAAEELAGVVIATAQNTPVYVSDVARILDTTASKRTESRIGFPGQEPQNTISLQIFKRTGGNILDIVDESKEAVETLQANQSLPNGLHVEKTNDNAVFIRDDLATLGTNGIQTMLLIFILLALVIGFREAVITGLSVPIAFLAAFIALQIQGMTLNGIVLFALVLSLGLMVDNSIVIIEGINEFMEKHGMNSRDAALASIAAYKWPIVSGTLTTVAAFLPMLLVSGIVGDYLSYMPKTITWTLLASLFVALVILPTIISRALKNGTKKIQAETRRGIVHRLIESNKEPYARLLVGILPSKKKRRAILAAVWVLFMVSLALPISGLMKIEMFPRINLDYFVINVELPEGSVLASTDRITQAAERVVARIPELKNYVTNLGTSASLGLTDAFSSGGGDSGNRATITVNLVDKGERERTSFAVADAVRKELEAIQGGTVRVQELSAGPPTGAPIEMRIIGNDSEALAEAARDITAALESIPGAINVETSISESPAEFTYTIDKQKANYYGLDIAAVAASARTAIFGATASTATIAGEDVDIMVKYDDAAFGTSSSLEHIILETPSGAAIPLSSVARLSLEPASASISHRNGDKVITVRAEAAEGASVPGILDAFNQAREGSALPEGISLEIGGEVEDIQQSFTEMFYSMILAVLLILIILVLQFNSFRQPFIIMFTLPLAMIGVIAGLMATRQPFSFPVFIGLVSLAGIAVNDAIVLIDKINSNIAEGKEFLDAIIDAGTSRVQPILLTTFTTVAGIFPLIWSSELWRGLSITIVFGLLSATFLTLVIIPVLYAGFGRKEALARQLGEH
ncbi:MAG: efflux RND transporter permease subunit [Parcubacteria group bacterium]|nr:efflux RND transporter permease subunit [Parcubacteria group bacterium]